MKLTWNKSKKRPLSSISRLKNLPFEEDDVQITAGGDGGRHRADDEDSELEHGRHQKTPPSDDDENIKLADAFQEEGNKLAEDGKYREALVKWEAALTLVPERATVHEQKAQVLLEVGEAWGALKAATRAAELEPSWAEAWTTLGRAQLNFGEPDSAIESFDRALAIKPDFAEARGDRQAALNLVKKRKQLHLSGLSSVENRYVVRDKA